MQNRPAALAACCSLLISLAPAAAAERGAATAVRTAAAVTPTAASTPQRAVRFRHQPTRPGDRVAQRLAVDLQLTTKITQSGQTAHESSSVMRREQQRTIEVLDVHEGRATRARATYTFSRRQSPDSPRPEEFAPQAIEGKSYLMARTGDELSITDAAGGTPPAEELKLALESLENVGKPNPLAALLVDRPVVVGERILVPRDLVQELLGFENPIGTVRRFELTLLRVDPADDQRPAARGVFQTLIMVVPNDESPLSIHLTGELAVEVDACRLAYVDLQGPVQLSSIERTAGGIYQYSAGGQLKLAIQSQFDRREVAAKP